MSGDPLLAGLLAARRVLEKSNPELLDWAAGQWTQWLQSQGSIGVDELRAIVAVAALTGIEDLPLHVGLMQLLASPGLRCTVILTFPTGAMTRLAAAKARREGWHALVHMMPITELTEGLSGLKSDSMLAFFPRPTALPSAMVEALRTPQPSEPQSAHGGPCFVGLAGDFGQWSEGLELIDQDHLIAALGTLLSVNHNGLAMVEDDALGTSSPLAERTQLQMGLSPEGRLEVSSSWKRGALLVSAEDSSENSVVVRQRRELLSGDIPFTIRMPASFLTVEPRGVRIELRDENGASTARNLQFHVPPSRLEPWMVSAFLNRGGGGNPVIRAFARGIGCRIAYAEEEPSVLRDIPVVWGVLRQSDRILAQANAQGLYSFYIDHAYFNRGHGKSYRITRNGYEAGPIRACPDDRACDLGVELVAWRKSGREIIICPPTEYFMQAHGCADWLELTLAKLRGVTDRPLIVRVKPQPGEAAVPLEQALASAHALVTHSSNVAIEAACLGTPVFVDAASAAAPVGRTDLDQIESPIYPDRDAWLAHLAYNQFSIGEIGDGRAWRMLLELEERELV